MEIVWPLCHFPTLVLILFASLFYLGTLVQTVLTRDCELTLSGLK